MSKQPKPLALVKDGLVHRFPKQADAARMFVEKAGISKHTANGYAFGLANSSCTSRHGYFLYKEDTEVTIAKLSLGVAVEEVNDADLRDKVDSTYYHRDVGIAQRAAKPVAFIKDNKVYRAKSQSAFGRLGYIGLSSVEQLAKGAKSSVKGFSLYIEPEQATLEKLAQGIEIEVLDAAPVTTVERTATTTTSVGEDSKVHSSNQGDAVAITEHTDQKVVEPATAAAVASCTAIATLDGIKTKGDTALALLPQQVTDVTLSSLVQDMVITERNTEEFEDVLVGAVATMRNARKQQKKTTELTTGKATLSASEVGAVVKNKYAVVLKHPITANKLLTKAGLQKVTAVKPTEDTKYLRYEPVNAVIEARLCVVNWYADNKRTTVAWHPDVVDVLAEFYGWELKRES